MASIDERIVSMVFENAKFEAGVATTMRTLTKLDVSLQQIGAKNSIADIEKAANKVTLQQPMSALDKLKSRLFGAGDGAAQGLGEIEKAGNKVTLEQPIQAINKVQSATADVSRNAPQAFSEIDKAANRVNFQGLSSAMDSVTAKFSILEGAATVALGNLTSQMSAKALNFAKGFGIGPVLDGLHEYETNLKSIQTIQANTDRPLTEINRSLAELNKYSDQTIYNFSEMAKNIGTFTAAGVDLKTATSSIKGIANMAALSGSTSQQAATAMYQLSQAISSGRVGLQDWNSVVNAGMGGKKLQTALATTAIAMGDISDNAVKLEGPMKKLTINGSSFRESIMAKPGSTSWLSSEILVNTLATLDGRFSKAALSAEKTKDGLRKYTDAQVEAEIATARTALEQKNGVKYTDEQFKALMKLSDSAFKSATEVKTLGQVFDVAKETIGSGWAASFQSIFGNLKEAKKTFTELSGSINDFINANALARNTALHDWKELGGRTDLIEGIKNAFKALFAILKPIGEAFRDIFPRKTGEELAEMTKNFADFTAKLKPSEAVIDGIKRTFRGMFAALHIGWEIVKGVIGVIGDLLGVIGGGAGGFLDFTGNIGDFVVALDDALTRGGLIKDFFDAIGDAIKQPMSLLASVEKLIFSLFGGFDIDDASAVEGGFSKIEGAAGPLSKALDTLKGAWKDLKNTFNDVQTAVMPWLEKFGDLMVGLWDKIASAFEGENFDKTMSALTTGFIGGIFFALKKAIGGVGSEFTGALKGINDVLGGLTGTLQSMQQHVKAQIITMIAVSIGVLAASTYTLSKIDPEGLSRAMTAISVGLGQLIGALAILSKFAKGGKFGLLSAVSVSMVILAGAMVILGGAMKIFATMSWEELGKGLAGVGGGLAILIGAMVAMTKTGVGGPVLIATAAGMFGMAVAMTILAKAVKSFSEMSWEELGRGLAGVLGVMTALIAPITAAGPILLPAAAGLIGISFAMSMLAGAVRAFGEMPLAEMAQGIAGVAFGLLAIGPAMWAIPPHAPLLGAGLLIVATALQALGGAVMIFGSMSVGELVKGLTAVGAALGVLAVGLTLMIVSLPGAAALAVAAAALAVLGPAMALLGNLKWGTILKSLATMALTMLTLGVAGTLAAPGLVALGFALMPLAGAFVIASVGVLKFAQALALFGDSGTKGLGVMIASITAFLALLPKIIIDFVKGLVDILAEVAKIAPMVVDSIVKIMKSIVQVVIESAPNVALALGVLIDSFVSVLGAHGPELIQAGMQLLLDVLTGIDNNIAEIVPKVGSIVAKFLEGMAQKAPDVIAAGAKFLVKYIEGIASKIPDIMKAAAQVGVKFLEGIGQNAHKFVLAGARAIQGFLGKIAEKLPDIITAGAEIVLNFIDGVSSKFKDVAAAATRFVVRFFDAFGNRKNVEKMVSAGFRAAKNILLGIADGIRNQENLKELLNAAVEVGEALVDGIVEGLKGLPGALKDKALGPVKDAVGWIKGKAGFDSHSPSRVFIQIGKDVVAGMGIGLAKFGDVFGNQITDPIQNMLKESKGLKAMGRFLGNEFADGLSGGLWTDGKSQAQKSIEGSFDQLRAKLKEGQKKLRDQIKSDQAELKQLRETETEDPKEQQQNLIKIEALRNAISKNQEVLMASSYATGNLMRGLKGTEQQLVALSKEYEDITKNLEAAKAHIENIENQYTKLPDADKLLTDELAYAEMTYWERMEAERKKREEQQKKDKIDQAALYRKSLEDQIKATEEFMATLEKLHELGLDDTTYQKLLSEGVSAQGFADDLLKSGKDGIAKINELDKKLAETAHKLAEDTAANLFNAGVKAAEGLIVGMQQKQDEIRGVMEFIADSMIKSLKKKLGIKSPSRVFAELAGYSMRGLAEGFKAGRGVVTGEVTAIGDDAVSAIRDSLSRIPEAMAEDIDMNPVIAPVLDMSEVKKGAKKYGKYWDYWGSNVTPITAAASYGQASAISAEKAASDVAAADSAAKIIDFKFEQNNSSPKALDDIEIYRQTNNQLATVKRALGLV